LTIDNSLEHETTYYWRVRAENDSGLSEWADSFTFTTAVADSNELEEIPTEITLKQNYPNPFNSTTKIRYGIPKGTDVELSVYNMLGQKVTTLSNQKKSSGWHTVIFDASGLSSGVYIYRIQTDGFLKTKKLTVIK